MRIDPILDQDNSELCQEVAFQERLTKRIGKIIEANQKKGMKPQVALTLFARSIWKKTRISRKGFDKILFDLPLELDKNQCQHVLGVLNENGLVRFFEEMYSLLKEKG